MCGKETDSDPQPHVNSKAINYLSVKEGKVVGSGGRDGMLYTTGSNSIPDGIYDPWAGSYKVKLNLDYNETLEVKPKGATSERTLNARNVAVWSDGLDGASTANGKAADDVTTW